MHKRNRSEGFVFITVLMGITLLTTIVSVFLYSIQVERTARIHAQQQIQARLLAQAGATAAQELIARILPSQIYTSLLSPWLAPFSYTTPDGTIRLRIEEESGLFPINAILLPDGSPHPTYMPIAKRLCEVRAISRDHLDCIADWIDTDTIPRTNGVERDWYQSQPFSREPRNAPFKTREELQLLRDGSNQTAQLLPVISTYSSYGEKTVISLININTAPADVLRALDPRMTDTLVERILSHRANTPFRTASELAQVPGMAEVVPSLQGLLTVKGNIFRIHCEAKVRSTTYHVETVVRISGVGSKTVLYWREH